METLFIKNGRDWLNEIESCNTGSIQWNTEVIKYPYSEDAVMHINSYLTLRDCSRQIELDFCSYGKKDFIKKMNKLNLLLSHLEEMKESLEKSYTLCKDDWEKRNED